MKTENNSSLLLLFSFILFAVLLLTSCNPKNTDLTDNELYSKNGLIYSRITAQAYTGSIKDTIKNQILEYEVVKGIKNGIFRITSSDGVVLMNGTIKNNKNEGKWEYFYSNGQLESTGNFKNDIAVDTWRWYYQDGKLKEEGDFKSGKRNGLWIMYDKDGFIKSKVSFIEGVKVYEIVINSKST